MIKIITEKRSDAIQIYSEALIRRLEGPGPGIEVITLDNNAFGSAFPDLLLELVNTLKIIFMVRRDDTVLFTDPLPINFLASAFMRGKKFTLFFHYDKEPSYYRFLPFVSLRKLLNGLDGIICSSNYSRSQLQTLGVDPGKCRVIYGGIDHQTFRPSEPKTYPFEYVLSIGSEEPRKNMKNILKAFRILKKSFPRLRLLKVGRASEENRKDTLRWIGNLRITEDVVFTDYVPEDELPSIYSGARLLLFPSLREGFGLPVAEAMACGCPVVTSDRDPLRELIGTDQKTVDPDSPEEMARECKAILENQEYRDTIIRNGLLRAREFDWKKTASAVLDYLGDTGKRRKR